ncbi:MAG: CrcB family protein [Halanaeroarchaeum sp.]
MGKTRVFSRRSIETVGLIAVGGFLGANARFLVARLATGPEGTLVVNALGSAILGLLLYHARLSDVLTRRSRLVVGTGVLSSFTTYSTFALHTYRLGLPGVAYAAGSYVAGFVGVAVGGFLARSLAGGETA